MNPFALILLIPFLAAILLALLPGGDPRISGRLSLGASLLTLLALIPLMTETPPATNHLFLADDLNLFVLLLTCLIGATTSLYNLHYIEHETTTGRFTPFRVRLYYAIYQFLIFDLILALLADNLILLWGAVEAATLGTMVMVALYRTREAIAAAWKYFILASVGIALALFGTILIYLAGQSALAPGMEAMAWSRLMEAADLMPTPLLEIAFIFLLVGYGTKAGLAPLHAWLPDAHAEGPTPISAVLSGLLLNVAMYALLRCKMILSANRTVTTTPGNLLILLGLISVIFAALMLYRRWHAKRLFAYSSIEHMGIMAFAFGIGTPLANFAGMLHMLAHGLTKSAIFFALGHAAHVRGSERIADMRGLTVSNPALGWSLTAAILAIAGLPPFGIFTSEFLLITGTFADHPYLTALLGIGLMIAFGALAGWIMSFAFGPPSRPSRPTAENLWAIYIHLILVLILGIHLPQPLADWMQRLALLLV